MKAPPNIAGKITVKSIILSRTRCPTKTSQSNPFWSTGAQGSKICPRAQNIVVLPYHMKKESVSRAINIEYARRRRQMMIAGQNGECHPIAEAFR